jgi:hypothetical protein
MLFLQRHFGYKVNVYHNAMCKHANSIHFSYFLLGIHLTVVCRAKIIVVVSTATPLIFCVNRTDVPVCSGQIRALTTLLNKTVHVGLICFVLVLHAHLQMQMHCPKPPELQLCVPHMV